MFKIKIFKVDEENDYEVASILQNHTADVKFLAWHPTEDVNYIFKSLKFF